MRVWLVASVFALFRVLCELAFRHLVGKPLSREVLVFAAAGFLPNTYSHSRSEFSWSTLSSESEALNKAQGLTCLQYCTCC
jgi:hypothetical protein